MDRTSLTHPLQIASLNAGTGRIGVTFCPGKYDRAAMTGSWNRDLGLDLDAIAEWGASAVVTLVEDFELKDLRVEDLGAQVERRGMVWLHQPIVDQSTPGPDFERSWVVEGQRLRRLLVEGRSIVVHCKGGLQLR